MKKNDGLFRSELKEDNAKKKKTNNNNPTLPSSMVELGLDLAYKTLCYLQQPLSSVKATRAYCH